LLIIVEHNFCFILLHCRVQALQWRNNMAFDLFVPFSAICLFIIIAIMKPDHVSEMVHIATETTGMKLVPLIAASIVCSLIISALVWAINSFLDERRQAAAWAVVTDKERKALIEFYHAAGGDNWTDNTNWCGKTGTKSVNDLSKYKSSYSWFAQGKSDLNNVRLWKGVTVNEEGRVTKLLLSKNNLRGDGEKMFAALLSECTLIEEIDFRENFIRGACD
jgi:hypothetical protein